MNKEPLTGSEREQELEALVADVAAQHSAALIRAHDAERERDQLKHDIERHIAIAAEAETALAQREREAPPTDLVQRCREIREWKNTGLLKQDGALVALAKTLKVPEIYRLRVAEDNTTAEAISFVEACAPALSDDNGENDGRSR